ncbi:MAG: tRNA adenosine(34) deaminase TadA [Porticoccaceae bacterium]
MDQSAQDNHWMSLALSLAERAATEGEVPVGALIVCGDQVVGEGWNRPIGSHDPTAHGEVVALRAAAMAQHNYRLSGCTLYVTLEPCTMCVGAAIHARIDRLVFGAPEPKAGAVVSRSGLLNQGHFNHRIAWCGGVLAERSRALMTEFFRIRRVRGLLGD